MTGSKKRTGLVVIAGLLALFVGLYALWFFTAEQVRAPKPDDGVNLPTDNLQVEAEPGVLHLYASNDDLSDLLPRVDTQLKAQGLNGDMDSEAFDYPDEDNEGVTDGVQSCVEFKYLKGSEVTAVMTLIPQDAGCFTADPSVQQQLAKLHADFRHVYAISLPRD